MNFEEKFKDKVRINLLNTQYDILHEITKELKWESDDDDTCDITWQDSALNPMLLSKMTPYQRVNHFPGIYAISRKDYLAKHLKRMEIKFPTEFNYFPSTWVLPQELNSLKMYFASNPCVLICKPPNSSQGNGIFLTKWISELPMNCVVQKYLDNPFLIDGYKFDLRLYVLVTGFDPLRVYLHEEGLVRLATNTYCKPTDMNMQNIFMHLTNYAINKQSANYIHNKSNNDDFVGHKRSFKTFIKNLELEGMNIQKLLKRIDDIIIKTLCTVQPFVSHTYRSSQPNDSYSAICFQILGFDIFLDNKLKPSLLEVNHTPSFTADTPLDKMVKKSVIKDCLKMIGVHPNCFKRFKIENLNFLVEKTYRNFSRVKDLRNERKERFLQNTLINENISQGGYRKIFPCDAEEKYLNYIKHAQSLYIPIKKSTIVEKKSIPSIRKRKISMNPSRLGKPDQKVPRRKSCTARVCIMPKIIHLNIN
jgi:tubulin polyglutamylase TTLL6/13